MAIEELTSAAPAAIGALGGGGITFMVAKFLLARMIKHYDEKLHFLQTQLEKANDARDKADKAFVETITSMRDKNFESEKQVAILIALTQESKSIRSEIQSEMGQLRGELNIKETVAEHKMDDMMEDLYVAHQRIRILSKGDLDIDKIQRRTNIRGR